MTRRLHHQVHARVLPYIALTGAVLCLAGCLAQAPAHARLEDLMRALAQAERCATTPLREQAFPLLAQCALITTRTVATCAALSRVQRAEVQWHMVCDAAEVEHLARIFAP